MVKTYLECKECGNVFSIWRKSGRQKPEGHIKHLYCYKCQQVTAHVELPKYSLLTADQINGAA